MLNDRIAQLISRKLSGEITDEELQELYTHMQSDPANQYFEELLISYWNSQRDSLPEHSLYADDHFKHILDLAGEDPGLNESGTGELPVIRHKRKNLTRKLGVAAVIAGIAFGIWKFIPQQNKLPVAKQDPENEVVAKRGARTKLLLPDGSQVWLNSESKLVYANTFNDTIREVELEGEAYFDVVKDARHPFIVHTSAVDIRVLGTAFDVKSYPAEPTIETTLIRGLIEVIKKDQPQAPAIILQPHQKLVVDKARLKLTDTYEPQQIKTQVKTPGPIAITTVPGNLPDTSIIETSWVYNKLLFEGDSFRELAKKMERWFNVKINFKSDKVANYRPRGSFTNETIEQALQELQIIFPFSYKISDNEVEIDKK